MRGGYLHTQRVSYEILSGDRCVEDIFIHTQRVFYEIFSGDRCVEDIFILRGCPMKYLDVTDEWRISSYTEGVL